MAYALGSSLLLLLLGLVTRRLLVDNFGPQITTASQVVSQLFNFFSIAEFGVGSVISYRLYEQIAAKNEEKISKYMSMYKWAYRVVGLVIAGLALIGAAAAAFAISPSLATWLQGNETLVNTLMYYTDAGSRIKDLDLSLLTVAQASQSAVAQIISGAQLPQQFQAAFINAVNTAPGATTMSTLLSQTIVNVSLSILSFLICFLGCYIVASFLIHLICYVFELPVLRHLDALMGGVFGLARGVLLLFIFFALVPIIQAVVPVQQLTDVFTASRLAPLFDSQIILSILGA